MRESSGLMSVCLCVCACVCQCVFPGVQGMGGGEAGEAELVSVSNQESVINLKDF